jgi:tripartite-type tricarboxylate transporter receptor subunit TctC
MPMTGLLLALFAVIAASTGPATAQVYPSRPITIVVAAPAGGPTDTIVRIMAERMRISLGQVVVIENAFGGASGSIGVGRAARAAPDGYTLSIGHWGNYVANSALYSLPYDPLKDFAPVALIADSPQIIISKNALPANDLRELIAWLKANPDKALAASAGSGSPPHVAGLFLQKLTGTRFQFIPYRGAALAMQDLLAGQTDFYISNATIALPHMRDGKIRAYGVTAKTRLTVAPDIPTVDEAGLPGFYFSLWHAFWVPKNTPRDAIAKLNAAATYALADPTVRARLSEYGNEIYPQSQQTPEALGAYHKAEIEKWGPIIKAAGIKGE